jgi:TRAP-type C4-dicarboxylate transport system substrate-binding protein
VCHTWEKSACRLWLLTLTFKRKEHKVGKRKLFFSVVVCLVGFFFVCGLAFAQDKKKEDPLAKWKPDFDYSGAKYKIIVSNVSHPILKGTFAGFAIRDELWKRSKGQIYIDYKPLSILGGEVEVMNQLQMGAIQGMLVSSVASTNLGPRFGLVNLPFLIDSFDKLDKFINSGKLFNHFLMSMDHQGIMAFDITSYGNYGWASTIPIKVIDDLKKVKIRIAESAVNKLSYQSWGINPVVMPWPEVDIALKQNVINGLDHTLIVCRVQNKFETCKFFTQINYAQGLFIVLFNKKWFESLPADLQKTLRETIADVCKQNRVEARAQEDLEMANAKAMGVEFFKLSDADMATLRKASDAVHVKFADDVNKLNPGDTYKPANYLKEVQELMGYKP